MMKKFLLLLLAVSAALLLTACAFEFQLPEDTEATSPTEESFYGPDGKPIEPTDPTDPPHIHSYTSEVTEEATCSYYGTMTYTCACGDSYSEQIEKKAHIFSEATCTKYSECTVCYEFNSDKLGHDFSPTICSHCGADVYDHDGPAVEILSINPTPAALGGEVTVRARAIDKSCVEDISVQLCSSAGNVAGGELQLAEGTVKDGIFEGTFTLPTGTPAGTWRVCIYLRDSMGNSGQSWGDPKEYFQVTGDITDTKGPVIQILSVTPNPAKLGGEVTVRAKATDESGVRDISVQLCSSAGNVAGGELQLVEGTVKDGIFEGTFTLPTDTPAGTWRACIYLWDIYGNSNQSWGDANEYFTVNP